MSDVKINELNYELYALDFAEGNLQGRRIESDGDIFILSPSIKKKRF
ncbi:MAG: hypothetical protein R2728_11115 [Chitinophagales bacterium]